MARYPASPPVAVPWTWLWFPQTATQLHPEWMNPPRANDPALLG